MHACLVNVKKLLIVLYLQNTTCTVNLRKTIYLLQIPMPLELLKSLNFRILTLCLVTLAY